PAESGPRHQQHSEKTDANRCPAPPPDPLVKQRTAKQCNQKRRRKKNRQRLVKLEVAQREKRQCGGSKQKRRATTLEEWSCRGHHLRPGNWIEKDERQQKGAEVARPDNLQRIHVTEQIFS